MDERKKLLQILGFAPKENTTNIFYKKYKDYAIEVDFEKKQFYFGEKIKIESKTTQNFFQAENWTVLECVNRLLEKGYAPEDITLEKTFKVGHGASGGRLDIYVKKEGKAFLMIECKTYGKEFNKELANTYKNGGQLLSYFQNDTNAQYLMLYASALMEDEIKIQQAVIKIENHYRDAGNVVDVYERWNKITLKNGIFEEWVKPYYFENKRITKNELIELDKAASTALFHSFLSILRKHSVSDKPNAFNVIFDLFLAKLWDEKKEDNDEMEFQWRENEDDAISFQYRLLDLYRDGMSDFLRKEVFGLKDSDFNAPTAAALKNIKKKVLMLEKVFNIKSVIDEASFEENHRVLKEIVELLQRYQIRYPRKQQHLSDFFERLLTTGLKQEAGQFFTPPPITRFIVKSLPIKQMLVESINQKSPELPAMIDYAVGSGHFLTEIMEEYQSLINTIDISTFKTDAKKKVQGWRIDEYDWAKEYVYGIDKDYRLVKVAKVGCYFYGDGLAQVIHGDGLDNFEHSKTYRYKVKDNAKKPQFQLVLSNPPYSVSAFKTTLNSAYAQKDFELFKRLTDRSSEIECLFIERTKQLLKTNGIAAIILPSSILSNTGIYSQAREIILKAFDIVAITELGSATFMATGTNTVTLFLKRREDIVAENIEKSLSIFFNNHKDITINGIEKSITKYLSHVWETISLEDYKTLLQKHPNEVIQQHELYKAYHKKIKDKKGEDKWAKIIDIEKEKLLYFILTYQQRVVLVKTGQKTKEKQFLGYEFSNRRGSEGMHPIQRSKTIDECTQLYDVQNATNENKASTYIYRAFTENKFDLTIPENLKENVSYQNLVDMLTFDRVDFEKNISLSIKKKVKFDSRWGLIELKHVAIINPSKSEVKNLPDNLEVSFIEMASVGNDGYIKKKINKQLGELKKGSYKYFRENDILIAKITPCMENGKCGIAEKLSNNIGFGSSEFHVFRAKEEVLTKYLFTLLNRKEFRQIAETNMTGTSGHRRVPESFYANIKIPLPPLNIQQKIVDEIDLLEKRVKKAVEDIEGLRRKVIDVISSAKGKLTKLDNITFKIGSGATPKGGKGVYQNSGITFIRSQNIYDTKFIEKGLVYLNDEQAKKLSNVAVEKNDILFNITGASIARCCIVEEKYLPARVNQHVSIIRLDEKAMPKYVQMVLVSSPIKEKLLEIGEGATSRQAITKLQLEEFKIPLPPLPEQQKIVTQIEKIEHKISQLEQQITEIPTQKAAILKKYL